jgi:hypothetical protein
MAATAISAFCIGWLASEVSYMTLAYDPAGCAMDRSEQFRDFAEECDRLAQEAETEQQRSALRKMAGAWRRVAEEYDRATDIRAVGTQAEAPQRA